jgi:heme exporter protein D
MPLEATTLLWLAVSLTAAAILFGSVNRRRSRLTESLREHVDRNQQGREAIHRGDEGSPD